MRFVFILVVLAALPAVGDDVTVPGATAYLIPDSGGARVSADRGISHWTDQETAVVWYGDIKQKGTLSAKLNLIVPGAEQVSLRLTVARRGAANGISHTATASSETTTSSIDFGTFEITEPGYMSFTLTAATSLPRGTQISNLVLDGPATKDAHFNLKPRRNAASVHLSYPIERGTEVSAFYCEMTGVEDPIWSYYMACGWHRGYFGMQVNSPTERRIIFSVWDSGNEGVDRDKVADKDRVTLVSKGEGVYSGDFGNEGTGGHSHLEFPWKTGEKQRFLVTAEPVSKTQTVYAGHYYRPDLKKWMLISSWKAPKEGGYMKGLYSFSENFVGRNGHVVRKALYGNQWIRLADGTWKEITTAKFSHDGTGKSDRLDRFMGIEDNQFFLSHGGFVDGFTKYGTPFDRPASKDSPENMNLPGLPSAR